MKGHPLLWADEAGIPVWSQGQPSPEIQRQRVEEIMHRYQGKIEFWEVVNEPSHLPSLKIDEPYRWARAADPRAYLIVNDYHVLPDGGPAFFKLLSEAKQNGVPFDGIGIQAHEPRTMRFPLDRVQKVLDQYATLGKELHITEFEPAASGQKITGSHRQGVWDEAAQADYAVKFYRVCFAHPGRASHYVVGLVRPGLVYSRRRDAASGSVAQAGLRATEATDPRGVEDQGLGHDGRRGAIRLPGLPWDLPGRRCDPRQDHREAVPSRKRRYPRDHDLARQVGGFTKVFSATSGLA